jgi:non-heme chloroperoxidase
LAFFVSTSACAERAPTVNPVRPGLLEVTTARGLKLDVIDWGGNGTPLIFLAGGGRSTPHIFDDFAPRFVDKFRVLGITRRSSGGSSDVSPRRFDDLVDDVVAVLDAMKLEKVVLAGHSFAGLELALFGEEHSDRCLGLIYLDSAYDYTDPALGRIFEANMPPEAPPMTAADSSSIVAMNAWTERTQGMRVPESEIRATRRFDSTGRLVGLKSGGPEKWRIRWRRPDWTGVRCQSLGIYAMPAPPQTALLYYAELDSTQRANAHAYYRAFGAWADKQREKFGRVRGNRVVEFPSSNHYFFLEKPDQAARVMRDFLSQLSDTSSAPAP